MADVIRPVFAPRTEDTLEDIIARHGIRKVGFALLRALLRHRAKRPPPLVDADTLTPYLRRDVGLPPEARIARRPPLPPFPLR
ncbi:hypothetical protein [Roseivivax isoporae]|uniref:Uncharacterized protein n=1 Tax=Roseivivax isoporae LMG 25204 TaxID=1449351 RepID=X7FEV3_9RHOB|nr:hypothetical protein [Roseivivax isoporae]ETX30591.1 hypothetical protein RISW2_12950 [Roseivivax isoporae LMG 25204]